MTRRTPAAARIVRRALFLSERLAAARREPCAPHPGDAAVADGLLERWCRVCAGGDLDRFERRLQWDGLGADLVRQALCGSWAGDADAAWVRILDEAMCDAPGSGPSPMNGEPCPFADVFAPFLRIARRDLRARLATCPIADEAIDTLENALAARLAETAGRTLLAEFDRVRPAPTALSDLLPAGDVHYRRFVKALLDDGFRALFETYPVLARLLATLTEDWIDSTAKLLTRLERDRPAIARAFGAADPGKVVAVWTQLSDPHGGGGTATAIEFASGLKVMYKPRPLDLEAAFGRLLEWCGTERPDLRLRWPRTICGEGYGWAEYIAHTPGRDGAALQRYYTRCGRLLAVLHMLGATDCHAENIVACGEHPVLVDAETALQPRARLLASDLHRVPPGTEWFADSVMRTGFVPRWLAHPQRVEPYDPSGLGGGEDDPAAQSLHWRAVNTDAMRLERAYVPQPRGRNRPAIERGDAADHDAADDVAAGFAAMHAFLASRRETLLAPRSILHTLERERLRFVFRETRIYYRLLDHALAPDHLRDGARFGIELDALSRAYTSVGGKPAAWPLLAAERTALERLDIPRLETRADTTDLELHGDVSIPAYFETSARAHARERVAALGPDDLAQQVAIIRGLFAARSVRLAPVASRALRLTASTQGSCETGSNPHAMSNDALIGEALAIGATLERRAIALADGSLRWLGLDVLADTDRLQLEPMGWTLYHGLPGIALFFAALATVTGDERYRDLALRAVQPLREDVRTRGVPSAARVAKLLGIGGASGLGSIVYALTLLHRFLDDPALLADASLAARWMTDDLIAEDERLDVIGGAAGAILGLLALHARSGAAAPLETANLCSEHLLARRAQFAGHASNGTKALTGYSHGAAGIAYALTRLYAATRSATLLEAADAAVAYETRVFAHEHANWPDFRFTPAAGAQPYYGTSWCHGAPGIGLARLGMARVLGDTALRRDIESAVETTERLALAPTDGLCCGNMGLSELLLAASAMLERPDLGAAARRRAGGVVTRARATRAYRSLPSVIVADLNPGLFQGLAGIGYELLRIARPDAVPSVLLWDA